eukprot:bmy_04745T0
MAQELAVLCGREIPGPIRSTGEYMVIQFTSDFSVQSGLTVAVHFEQPFQIPNRDSSCNQGDYLVLKNGPDISSPPLGPHGGNGHFCGSRPSSTLFTSDNQMFVQFISDNSNEGRGFKITYEAKSLACGGNIYIHDADSAGYVTSPNHPSNYPQHADCIWFIAAPPGKLIRLQFEDQFNVEVTPNCTSNYLELRDGADSNAPMLSKFCGASLPAAECGGRVTGQSGVIESNGYPTLPYTDDLFCEWHLQGPSGHYLTIRFEDFNLQDSSGCERDFVEIWENHTSACGGDLQGPAGTFTSPNYLNPNPHGWMCEWRITAQEGRRVALTFDDLRLEAHAFCSSEHVTVFNGIRSNSPQLEKLCSSVNGSNEIKSSGNTMKVVYFTDGSRPYGGFSASYTSSEDAVCGGSLTDSAGGNFTSPGYDGVSNYSRNLNCEWTLSNPNQGNSSIYIHFEDFYLESHQDCQFDVLEFRAGNADGLLIWRLCGASEPRMPLVIPYPQVWIHFVTNERVEHVGFHAQYSFTEVYNLISDCGGVQIGESGVISSPNYPASYDSLTHCSWLLEAPQGHTITLTFSDFDIEAHATCAWDSVTVRNGGSPGSPIIGHYCGSSNPRTIQSGSNQLVVIFNTDHSVQNGGFYATWNTETLGCGGILHLDNGTIRSPHWPQNFPENSRCSWTVITHQSKHLELSFDNNFFIPSGDGQCRNSFVKVWAGTQEADQALLASSCGNVAPGPVITPRNAFTAVFQSQEVPAQGFSASFVSRCGRNFTNPSGYIVSPNYPKQYDNNMNCTYIIEASPLSVVLLTFVSFHLEARSTVTGSCVNDGVHIVRGYSLSSTPLATLCGDESLSPVTISGPVLLNFYSNAHTTDLGFKFSYRITPCGGVFNLSTGVIKSPFYSYSAYPNNMHCLYTITIRDDRVIQL